MRILILLIYFLSFSFALEIQNGKTFFLHVKDIDVTKALIFMDKKYTPLLVKNEEVIYALPIDYKVKLGEYKIEYFDSQNTLHVKTLFVQDGEYKKEQLKVDPKKVNPPKELQDRIYKEYKEAMDIYNTNSSELLISKPFDFPMNSKITSTFGNARVFNEQLKSYHSGTDFRAKVGTKVSAVNDGVVVLASNRYYAGGSIVIDHGKGIYSCYFHLSKFLKKVGERVNRGDTIALSGKSGRVTGPHLHFGFKIEGKSVDPLDFIEKFNALLASN